MNLNSRSTELLPRYHQNIESLKNWLKMYGFLKPEVAGCCESLEETLLFVNSEEGCNCQVHYIVHRPQEKLG